MREFEFLTLDDVEVAGKKVLLRVDINSPIDPETLTILDDSRIRATLTTLKDLEDAAVVLMSHQSRPGKKDFTSLKPHALFLKKYLGDRVKFIDDIFGPAARKEIKKLPPGKILILENVRFYSEENIEAPPKTLARTHLVRKLAHFFDLFVNDAFPAIHRSQSSLVGFAEVLPTVAGRLMEKELKALQKVLQNPEKPCVFFLGGAKVPDKMEIMLTALQKRKADKILLGGLLANIFLEAAGYDIGEENKQTLLGFEKLKNKAKIILEKYRDAIELPKDVAVEINNERMEVPIDKLPVKGQIKDIGINTIIHYSKILSNAATIVANGPAGIFEEKQYAIGTTEILHTIANSKAYKIIGGGHLGAIANILNLNTKINHISTGGGAALSLLAGQKLPVIEALTNAAKRHKTRH